MSTSPLNTSWDPGTLYVMSLDEYHPTGCLYGFRGKSRSQKRYFRNQAEIDDYLGEMWLYGFNNITIEEVDD